MENDLDGYGQPFTPHAQMFHARSVKDALDRHEQEKQEPKPQYEKAEWKELPAGHWDKTPKNTGSLDG